MQVTRTTGPSLYLTQALGNRVWPQNKTTAGVTMAESLTHTHTLSPIHIHLHIHTHTHYKKVPFISFSHWGQPSTTCYWQNKLNNNLSEALAHKALRSHGAWNIALLLCWALRNNNTILWSVWAISWGFYFILSFAERLFVVLWAVDLLPV